MTAAIDEPIITSTALGPGHDGRPEVVVTLVYANDGTAQLSLDQEMVERAIAGTDITDLAQLVGRPWSVLFPPTPADPSSLPADPISEETPLCST